MCQIFRHIINNYSFQNSDWKSLSNPEQELINEYPIF